MNGLSPAPTPKNSWIEDFPEGPIRSLDALHLASVLSTVALIPETALLTHDVRVRGCALALGLRLLPPPT